MDVIRTKEVSIRIKGVAAICNGYILLRCPIYITHGKVPNSSQCTICRHHVGRNWHRYWIKSDEIAKQTFAYTHPVCSELIRQARKECNGSGQKCKGLAMVLYGCTLLNTFIKINDRISTTTRKCLFCAQYCTNESPAAHFITKNGRFTSIHKKCLGPFLEEQSRVCEIFARRCCDKVWVLPLGDCRIVICSFLIRLQQTEDVYGAMYGIAQD